MTGSTEVVPREPAPVLGSKGGTGSFLVCELARTSVFPVRLQATRSSEGVP